MRRLKAPAIGLPICVPALYTVLLNGWDALIEVIRLSRELIAAARSDFQIAPYIPHDLDFLLVILAVEKSCNP